MLRKKDASIAGWGNYPVGKADFLRPEKYCHVSQIEEPLIPRGLGRSYGDASLNIDGSIVLMERLNRMLEFDEATGILRAEAGVTLEAILDVFVPRGWFLPVTPGTKFVTLGGCVACDVHGKNHHLDGTLGSHVKKLELILGNGVKVQCSPTHDANIFWATVGGMGLTGIISEVTLQLIPIQTGYMVAQHYPTRDLEETLLVLEDKDRDDRYSVAWIDCLSGGKNMGRSVVMNAHHAVPDEILWKKEDLLHIPKKRQHSLPFNFPPFALNSTTIKIFNSFYYRWQRSKKEPHLIDYDSYFYPLDAISNWNRLYGKKGFVQYQFVVPHHNAQESLELILNKFTQSRRASFLALLKRFGQEGKGMLSFPKEGYTLALDIPVSKGLLPFLNELDELVIKYEGRVYLAKDARMRPESFRAMYPRHQEWLRTKMAMDPEGLFSSSLSRRLAMEGQQ